MDHIAKFIGLRSRLGEGHISYHQKWEKLSLHPSWTNLAMWARTPSSWKVHGALAYFELTQRSTLDLNISF